MRLVRSFRWKCVDRNGGSRAYGREIMSNEWLEKVIFIYDFAVKGGCSSR